MRNIDTDKLSKEMNDTLVHRACVMRSGQYLSRYLIHRNRSVDAIRLIGRCSVHDMSKIQNTEEFMLLASIVDQMDDMQDIKHVLSPEQVDAIKLHWKRNSHHPEYYDNPNDMSEMDLLEMACDCHARSKQYGTSLIEYITIQQDLRFHFDREHFRKLKAYCTALVEMTKDDDYSQLLNPDTVLCFDLKDSTMRALEKFDEVGYIDSISTDRLFLTKEDNPDFASVVYSINKREDNTEIGHVSVKCNGIMEYMIYEGFKGNGYGSEALSKIIECTNMNELFIILRRDNEVSRQTVVSIGFMPIESNDSTVTYRYRKPNKSLKKIINA